MCAKYRNVFKKPSDHDSWVHRIPVIFNSIHSNRSYSNYVQPDRALNSLRLHALTRVGLQLHNYTRALSSRGGLQLQALSPRAVACVRRAVGQAGTRPSHSFPFGVSPGPTTRMLVSGSDPRARATISGAVTVTVSVAVTVAVALSRRCQSRRPVTVAVANRPVRVAVVVSCVPVLPCQWNPLFVPSSVGKIF